MPPSSQLLWRHAVTIGVIWLSGAMFGPPLFFWLASPAVLPASVGFAMLLLGGLLLLPAWKLSRTAPAEHAGDSLRKQEGLRADRTEQSGDLQSLSQQHDSIVESSLSDFESAALDLSALGLETGAVFFVGAEAAPTLLFANQKWFHLSGSDPDKAPLLGDQSFPGPWCRIDRSRLIERVSAARASYEPDEIDHWSVNAQQRRHILRQAEPILLGEATEASAGPDIAPGCDAPSSEGSTSAPFDVNATLVACLMAAPAPLMVLDADDSIDDARIEMVNDAFVAFFGGNVAEAGTLSHWIRSVVIFPTREAAAQAIMGVFRQAMHETGVVQRHVWLHNRDGEPTCVDLRVQKVDHRLVAVASDVMPQFVAQNELREARNVIEGAIDVLDHGLVIYDREGSLLFWNHQWAEMSSLPQDFLRQGTERATVLQRSKVDRLIPGRLGGRRENQVVDLGGRLIVIDDYRTPDGGLVSIYADVTEQRAIERKLIEQQNQFEFSLAAVGAHYFTDDGEDLARRYLGGGLAAELGYADLGPVIPHEVWQGLIHPDDRRLWGDFREQLLSGLTASSSMDYRLRMATGDYAWISERVHSHVDSGSGRTLLSGISSNITRRKELEFQLLDAKSRAEAADRAKSDFIANVSHELRTPIHAILGFTEPLQRALTDERHSRYIEMIQSSGDTLLDLVNDILDLTKIQVGHLSLDPRPVDLLDLIRDTVALCQFRLSGKAVELVVDMDPEIPRVVILDPVRMKQVLLNLLTNALKFTEAGHVCLRLEEVGGKAPRGDITCLRIEVVDTGIGIPEDRLEMIFKPFQQSSANIAESYGGTGLGLTISRHLTELMGGDITVESAEGVGSKFSLSVPVEVVELAAAPSSLMSGKVCLVVKSPELSQAIQRQLLAYGYNVETVDRASLPRVGRSSMAIIDTVPAADGRDEFAAACLFSFSRAGVGCVALVDQRGVQGDTTATCFTKPVLPYDLLQSLHGRGSKAVFTEPSRSSRRRLSNSSLVRSICALAVDDSNINLSLIELQLAAQPIDLVLASSGGEALDLVRSQRFDVILMDCTMPLMDGYETTRQLRDMEFGREVPIIAVTASASEADRRKAEEAGMQVFLPKPFDSDSLIAAIAEALNLPLDHGDKLEVPSKAEPAPQLDVEAGLSLCEGHKAAYSRLLQTFKRDYGNFCAELEAAMLADSDEARRKLHTLRGTAGFLGATELAEIARDLELRVGSHLQFGDPKLETLAETLASVLEEIPAAVEELNVTRDQTAGDRQSAEISRPNLDVSYAELRQALIVHDAKARRLIESNASLWTEELGGEECARLLDAVRVWDFELALRVLDALLAEA